MAVAYLPKCVFEIPQVPFGFEFESERPNGNSVTNSR